MTKWCFDFIFISGINVACLHGKLNANGITSYHHLCKKPREIKFKMGILILILFLA